MKCSNVFLQQVIHLSQCISSRYIHIGIYVKISAFPLLMLNNEVYRATTDKQHTNNQKTHIHKEFEQATFFTFKFFICYIFLLNRFCISETFENNKTVSNKQMKGLIGKNV